MVVVALNLLNGRKIDRKKRLPSYAKGVNFLEKKLELNYSINDIILASQWFLSKYYVWCINDLSNEIKVKFDVYSAASIWWSASLNKEQTEFILTKETNAPTLCFYPFEQY